MKRAFVWAVLPIVLLHFLAAPVLARKWTDRSGTFSVDADLVGLQGDHAQLLKADGTIIKVPIAQLSKVDQQFLAAQRKAGPNPIPQMLRIEAALAKNVTLEFKQTPLRDVVGFLSDLHKIGIHLNTRALEDLGVGSDSTVTISVKNTPFGEALEQTLKPLDLQWLVAHDVLIITTNADHERRQFASVYTPPAAPLNDQLVKDIQTRVAPRDWAQVGGAGALHRLSGGDLVISQSYQNHRRIQRLFSTKIRRVNRDVSRLIAHPQIAMPVEALNSTTSLEFVDAPLQDVITHLANRHKVALELDAAALEEVGLGTDTSVSHHLSGIRLSSALDLLTSDLSTTWTMSKNKITITTLEKSEANLIEATHEPAGGRPQEVAEMLTASVSPATWSAVGGAGSISVVASKLKIKQTLHVHLEIARLLDDLRHARKNRN